MADSRQASALVSLTRRVRSRVDRIAERVRSVRRRQQNRGRAFRPVFVAGAIGSGTSLLAASLGQRFEVAGVALESARGIDPRSCWWIDRVQSFDSIRAYEERLAPRPDWTPERVRGDLLDLYRSLAVPRTGARSSGVDPSVDPSADSSVDSFVDFFVDKGPNTNLVRAGLLARAFPDARFVLIFRDPVANIEGFRRKWTTFRDDRLDESVRFWAAIHERFLEQAAQFPERVFTVEYEALVADYGGMLAALGTRLSLRPRSEARPVEARIAGKGRGLRGVEGGRIHVVRDANARSYAALDAEDVARIRERLGPLYARLRALAAESGFAVSDAARS